tara:strand:- start:11088 stop:12332 length:1245 start_codon:yes stop_codon:yes gene_type:complete
MTEYIYLLQEREFIKTKENIYKIGRTKQENLKRICNYDKGSILICQFICNDCNKLEKELKTLFREKYELRKDIGNEYFKGNYIDMRDDIYNYIKNEIRKEFIVIDDDETDDDETVISKEQLNEIENMFPNYKDDESFGGTKKLIKISFEHNPYDRINTYYINDEKEIDQIFLQTNWFKKDAYDNSDYISKLLKNNVIQDGMIYDFNDSRFIKKLNKHKDKINITYTDENIIDMISKFKTLDQNNVEFRINRMLYNNCLLHEEIYCDYINNTLYIEFIIPYNNSLQINDTYERTIEKHINVIKYNAITYDELFLRKYTPYMIEYNDNQYYLYNRDYQVIDINEKKFSIENWKGKRLFLYKDGFNPSHPNHTEKERRKLMNDMNLKYRDITLNKSCMNMNENTQIIIFLMFHNITI